MERVATAIKVTMIIWIAIIIVAGAVVSPAFGGIYTNEPPPQDEDAMIASWIEGMWTGTGLYGPRPVMVHSMTPEHHEEILHGVDLTLNTRLTYEHVSRALHAQVFEDADLPRHFAESEYHYRDYVVSEIIGVRGKCGGGSISLGYTSQRFRDGIQVKKAVENVQGQWASTRFLVARFVGDLRLLAKLLATEKDERVLTMLCLRASGHIAMRGRNHETFRSLVMSTIENDIESEFLLKTLAFFMEDDYEILRKLADSEHRWVWQVAYWRMRNLQRQ